MRSKIFKSIICLAAFIGLIGVERTYAQQEVHEALRQYIHNAQTAYERGEYPDALKAYQEALKLVPDFPELYKAIGDVYEKLGTVADLKAAIEHYKRYIELAPDAADVQQIKEKIADLEYWAVEQEKRDRILDDLSGEWVAMDNIKITKKEDDGRLQFISDFIFQITERQKTGRFRVTMKPGSRCYSANLIEKTVCIAPARDDSFTFTFADTNSRRYGHRMSSWLLNYEMIRESYGISRPEIELPINPRAIYAFDLKYEDGRLVGFLTHTFKLATPTWQRTTGKDICEITFVKKDDRFNELLRSTIEENADVIDPETFRNKWGEELSGKEIAEKLYAFDPSLGKKYQKTRNIKTAAIITTFASIPVMATGVGMMIDGKKTSSKFTAGAIMSGSSLVIGLTGTAVWTIIHPPQKRRLIDQYNRQVIQQHKNKLPEELRFGITPAGGIGLTLTF
jgi:tetratricopeptide (TPR) repeat protein